MLLPALQKQSETPIERGGQANGSVERLWEAKGDPAFLLEGGRALGLLSWLMIDDVMEALPGVIFVPAAVGEHPCGADSGMKAGGPRCP
jgi:hypothetical protein